MPDAHTECVIRLLREHWPLLLAVAVFVGMSFLVQANVTALQTLFEGSSALMSVGLFLLIGIVLVMIPTASILPFMPLAVTLWGWPATALLTLVAWVIGGQILFEVARAFGKPVVAKLLPVAKLDAVAGFVQHGGLAQSILVRTVVHGDMISYAFGLFSNIRRWQYLFVSTVGVAPSAFMYAYVGSLSLAFQLAMVGVVLLVITLVWWLKSKSVALPSFLPRFGGMLAS